MTTTSTIRQIVTANPAQVIYSWQPGASIKIPPEVAAAEMRRLYEQTGALRPEDLLASARDPQAPLHPAFEWDDSTAAEAYRITQARKITRSIVVAYRKSDGELTEPVRLFVRVTPRDDDPVPEDDHALQEALEPRNYIPINRVLNDAELTRRYERQAYLEFMALRRKHRNVRALREVFEAIDRLAPEFKAG